MEKEVKIDIDSTKLCKCRLNGKRQMWWAILENGTYVCLVCKAVVNEKDLEDENTKDDVDDMVHVKVNFPPFQHYKLDENNSAICVGKSHWKGGVKTGEFSKDHGKITDKLARMFIMLCEKYAMKFNWRGYTYNDEMRNSAILQLTYVGLRFNEAKSANPFAYYTAAITNSFCRVLNTEKRNQNIRDDILEMNGLNPSYTRQMRDQKFNVYEE